MLNNVFPKITPFVRECLKIQWRPKNRHNMAHTRCVLYDQGYVHLCACTRPRFRAPTCTHARAIMHTQTNM
jgi:hypothetical protein